MGAAPAKEMQVSSDPVPEHPKSAPKLVAALFQATFTAVVIAGMGFFILTGLSIAVLALYGAVTGHLPDFTRAYRYVGAPGALVLLVGTWIYSFAFFRRRQTEKNR